MVSSEQLLFIFIFSIGALGIVFTIYVVFWAIMVEYREYRKKNYMLNRYRSINLLEEGQRCEICKIKFIENDATSLCPRCDALFLNDHLLASLSSSPYCPNCQERITRKKIKGRVISTVNDE